jgi:hypothetical protein
MSIFKKDLLARYILVVLAFGLFSAAVVTSSHFAPKAERQFITLQHQVRRVLQRAERETLRSSASSDEGTPIDQPQRIGPVSRPPEIAAERYQVLPPWRTLSKLSSVTLDLSTILNL